MSVKPWGRRAEVFGYLLEDLEEEAGAAVVDLVGGDAAGDFGEGVLQGDVGRRAGEGEGFACGGAGAAGVSGEVLVGGARAAFGVRVLA
jgi:hypothetical protein